MYVGENFEVHGKLAGDGRIVDVAEVDVALLEDDAVPDRVDAAPAGTAHELRQLAARQRRKAHPVEFRERRDDTGARRHVEPERQRLGGEDDLDQTLLEQALDDLLRVGEESGVMHREPATQQAPVQLEEHAAPLVVIDEDRQLLGEPRIDALLLLVVGEVDRMHAAALQRFATPSPREDEIDRGEHRAPAQHLDHLEQVVVRSAPRLAKARLLHGIRLRQLERAACRVSGCVEQRVERVVDGEPHLERNRALGARHRLDGAAQRRHPRRDFRDVADRG